MTTETTKPAAKKGNSKKPATAKATVNPVANSVNVLTVNELKQALVNANALYLARCKQDGKAPKLNAQGMSSDIQTAYKLVSGMTEAHLKEVAQMGLNDTFLNCLKDASNIKKTKRIAQALLFALTGNGNYLQMSAKAWFLGYVGLVACGVKTVEGLKYCISGKGDSNTSDQLTSTEKANKILKKFGGGLGKGSTDTCYSVAFSEGGIATALQCAKKDSRTGLPTANPESPVIQKLDAIINKATDGYIELLVAQAGKSK